MSAADLQGGPVRWRGARQCTAAHALTRQACLAHPHVTAPPFSEGKDLIISYTVKHEQVLDCGGAYIKVRAMFHPEPRVCTMPGDTSWHGTRALSWGRAWLAGMCASGMFPLREAVQGSPVPPSPCAAAAPWV